MISLYLAQQSWLHRQPAALKLIVMATMSIGLYFVTHPLGMVAALLAVLAVYGPLGKSALQQLSILRPLVWLFGIMFLVQWWTVGLAAGLTLVLRMSTLILLANLITLTTRMDDMMTAITPALYPLRWVGVDPRRIAFAVALLIRFVPVLMGVMHSLNESWRARGGGLRRWRLAIPMAIQAIRLADHVSEALASRGGVSPTLSPVNTPSFPFSEKHTGVIK